MVSPNFVRLGRRLRPGKRGRKKAGTGGEEDNWVWCPRISPLAELEQTLGRRLRPGKRGRKKAATGGAEVN